MIKGNKPEKHEEKARLSWPEFDRWVREKHLLLFSPLDVARSFNVTPVAIASFLHRHTKKGRLLKLRSGLYTLTAEPAPEFLIANKLYEPSYISLETALSFHRLKPETVYAITSVTTRKTKTFDVSSYTFPYHHIKRSAFTGYGPINYQGITIFMAEPEKALVDHLYLRIIKGRDLPTTLDGVFDRLRKDRINKAKAIKYAKLFNNDTLIAILKKHL